jgi:probable addiction module antidote protein
MKRKKIIYRDFQEILLENLQDAEIATAYLKVALADEDERIFLLALRDVLEARGTIADLAEETHLNKQNLYRMLSKKGNPRFTSLKTVLHAIGFEMDIHPIKK